MRRAGPLPRIVLRGCSSQCRYESLIDRTTWLVIEKRNHREPTRPQARTEASRIHHDRPRRPSRFDQCRIAVGSRDRAVDEDLA